MKTMTKIALLTVMATALASCVQSREPRNGVFNENVYLRKDFLIRSGDNATSTDPGWMLKATIVSTSSPNPLSMGANGFVAGYHSGGQLVRFRVLQDHLDMIDMREINADTDPTENVGKVPEVANSWGVTNVDLQYQVSLDGEKTNFYQENQERPWEQRQWVKLNLAKNDMSDVAALGYDFYELLNTCGDVGESSSVLQPESVYLNENTGYLEWTVQLTVPFLWSNPSCAEAYGGLGTSASLIGRQNVTMNLKYSLTRADPAPTYKPFVIGEKDAIRHKYGPLTTTVVNRDINTGLLAAQEFVTRHDPSKPIVYYFDKDFPPDFKQTFLAPNGIVDQTNALLMQSGAAARLSVLDYNANIPDNWTDAEKARGREFGDVRFNFIRWMKDQDLQPGWVGVTQFVTDPRNGLVVDTDVIVNELNQATYMYWYDQFLASVGASTGDLFGPGEWTDPPSGPTCQDGDTLPLVADARSNWIGTSTLFSKMQGYLGRDPALWGNLGPTDFVNTTNQTDPDFQRAYYTLLPYEIFADPDANQFVTREGGAGVYGATGRFGQLAKEAQFHQIASDIDHGLEPYAGDSSGQAGIVNAAAFLNNMRSLTTSHHTLDYQNLLSMRSQLRMAEPSGFTFEQMMLRSARHCVGGKWETKAEYLKHMHDSYWTFTLWHEFGHSIGLDHNFMASVDAPNFPHYKDGAGRDHVAMYSSSAMEYPGFGDDFFWHQGWGPYDRGAIAWIYANNAPTNDPQGKSISGQIDATKPWKDPAGFDSTGKEISFLRCDASHMKYTPLCRQFDEGTTPSEIMANDITRYEWTYQYRNFRAYRKYWNESGYANSPAGAVYDMRKFISLWVFDWSGGEIQDTLRRVGLTNPDPNGSDAEYFQQLDDKFNAELSMTNQMVAAFHKGIIQQGSGERPFATVYDKFYGDVTQQGIILDKLFAMQGWVGMWPTDNYDQNQAGAYLASYSGIGDSSYNSVAEDAVDSMVGGQYNVYPYFRPLAVTQFAQDTHDPSFSGRLDVRDWTGGQPFTRLQDFLDYFRNIAVQNNYDLDHCGTTPPDTGFSSCQYDPRDHSDTHHEFIAPDKRVYIWSYVPDRNMYIAVQKDRNTASYIIVRSYNDDVVNQLDDGSLPGNAYGLELPMKYFMDSFNYYR